MQKLQSETGLPEAAWKALQAIYKGQEILVGAQACQWASDESHALPASPLAVVTPLTHEQVTATVQWANTYGIALVASGGRTGLSGGACAGHGELVISFARMNRLLEFDVQGGLLTVEAGMTLHTVQELARKQGWFYPVDYASRGSAQMGGAVATNAGGIRVLRYGMTRDWIAGLKAVTGTAETLCINRHLVKDNAGYDLKQLLAGSEGTLAMITEVTLRLTRPLAEQTTLLAGFASFADMVAVFVRLRALVTLNAAEFFCAGALARVVAAHGYIRPLQADWAFYLLLEFDRQALADEQLALLFAEQEVVVSHHAEQTHNLWRYREQVSSTINPLHPYKNDIACRLACLSGWIADLEQGFLDIRADLELLWFGHLGDGNVHVNVLKPAAMDSSDFEAVKPLFSEVIARVTATYSATASAEHGIGYLKKNLLSSSRSAVEIGLYRQIKNVFDPNGILNPHKLF